MAVSAVFAGIHVADLAASVAWYERFAGRPPDLVPNDDEAAGVSPSPAGSTSYATPGAPVRRP